MTELEELYKKKQQERQEYLKELAVYNSKIDEATSRISELEKELLANVDGLSPDLREVVLKTLNRPEDEPISREYFESLRTLFRTLDNAGKQMLKDT